jgi:hypothetical protein
VIRLLTLNTLNICRNHPDSELDRGVRLAAGAWRRRAPPAKSSTPAEWDGGTSGGEDGRTVSLEEKMETSPDRSTARRADDTVGARRHTMAAEQGQPSGTRIPCLRLRARVPPRCWWWCAPALAGIDLGGYRGPAGDRSRRRSAGAPEPSQRSNLKLTKLSGIVVDLDMKSSMERSPIRL